MKASIRFTLCGLFYLGFACVQYAVGYKDIWIAVSLIASIIYLVGSEVIREVGR